ncbi:hypothetical protein C8R44DRAFT_734877 [Mycena epipterygia]|nr:hypothetical protein C8R44DRAFT_734877 [Mycena epipterygia]
MISSRYGFKEETPGNTRRPSVRIIERGPMFHFRLLAQRRFSNYLTTWARFYGLAEFHARGARKAGYISIPAAISTTVTRNVADQINARRASPPLRPMLTTRQLSAQLQVRILEGVSKAGRAVKAQRYARTYLESGRTNAKPSHSIARVPAIRAHARHRRKIHASARPSRRHRCWCYPLRAAVIRCVLVLFRVRWRYSTRAGVSPSARSKAPKTNSEKSHHALDILTIDGGARVVFADPPHALLWSVDAGSRYSTAIPKPYSVTPSISAQLLDLIMLDTPTVSSLLLSFNSHLARAAIPPSRFLPLKSHRVS